MAFRTVDVMANNLTIGRFLIARKNIVFTTTPVSPHKYYHISNTHLNFNVRGKY